MSESQKSKKAVNLSVLSALYVPTGRILSGKNSNFSKLPDGGFQSHEVAEINRMLIDVPLIKARAKMNLYRGRKSALNEPLVKADFGPPPKHLSTPQRYNYRNDPRLYLCDSIIGVQRELAPIESNEILWLIKYRIPLEGLRIANLCDLNNEELNDLMFRCELCYGDEEPSNLYPSQEFSRSIASILSKRFDGIQIFGCRGDSTFRYRNVVIFNHTNWQNWVADEPFQFKDLEPERE